MKKIPSLFQRNYTGDRKVRDELVPGSEWVANGEGAATRKWGGLAVKIEGGVVFVRYDAKAGRTPPKDFVPVEAHPDVKTGHWPGWVPAVRPKDARLLDEISVYAPADGTYEFCGPSVGTRHGANPENLASHILVPHGIDVLEDCPRDYYGILVYLMDKQIEGIVWHHPDGRMVKIKKADFPYEIHNGRHYDPRQVDKWKDASFQ